jgi:hypothetical protein
MSSLFDTRFLRVMAVEAARTMAGTFDKEPCRTSKLQGAAYVQELRTGHEGRAYEVLRMPINVFEDLCSWLRENSGLEDATEEPESGTELKRTVTVEEAVAIFLYIVGRGAANRDAQERFQHSGETISR